MDLHELLQKLDEELDEATDVKKIKVKHPGILEVPEGKSVRSMSEKHFKELIKRKGWAPISRALMNLVRWNKNRDESLSHWAHGMQKKLSAWVDKEKSKGDNYSK